MQHTEAVHEKMHGFIDNIVDAKTHGEDAKAESLYRQIAQCSDSFVEYLEKLNKQIN